MKHLALLFLTILISGAFSQNQCTVYPSVLEVDLNNGAFELDLTSLTKVVVSLLATENYPYTVNIRGPKPLDLSGDEANGGGVKFTPAPPANPLPDRPDDQVNSLSGSSSLLRAVMWVPLMVVLVFGMMMIRNGRVFVAVVIVAVFASAALAETFYASEIVEMSAADCEINRVILSLNPRLLKTVKIVYPVGSSIKDASWPNLSPVVSCDTAKCTRTYTNPYYPCQDNFLPCTSKLGVCTNITTNTDCGDCDVSCGSELVCANKKCSPPPPIACPFPLANCDLLFSNGCETNTSADPVNCGGCNQECSQLPNSDPYCANATCVFTCNSNFADCDGVLGSGCEVDTRIDPSNCNGCGLICTSYPFSNPTCTQGVCNISCNFGHGDCDANIFNGCETGLVNNTLHCGSCLTPCLPRNNSDFSCESSQCVYTCMVGFSDCDANPLNGCESDTSADPNNCGGCGTTCTASAPNTMATCSNNSCGSTCLTGFASCGIGECDTNIATDVNHCGSCLVNCTSIFNSTFVICSNGTCALNDACSPTTIPPVCGTDDCFYNGSVNCGKCCGVKQLSAPYCAQDEFCGVNDTCCQTSLLKTSCCDASTHLCLDNPDFSSRNVTPQVCVPAAAPCTGVTCSGALTCFSKNATTPACGCCNVNAAVNCSDPLDWCEHTVDSLPVCCNSNSTLKGFTCCDSVASVCLDTTIVFANANVTLPSPNVCQQINRECDLPLVITCTNGCVNSNTNGTALSCT